LSFAVYTVVVYDHDVIRSFADAATEDLFHGRNTKAARRFPRDLWHSIQRKLERVNAAADLSFLAVPPANRLEPLKGDQKGRFSIRINARYRLTFRFEKGTADDVRVEDYHS
jgi:proteic killer suppression protein